MQIVKVNGARNDFALLDERPPRVADYPGLARTLCDRDGPLGADGLLVVAPRASDAFAATMRIFNADGSEAEMCGNGIRCVARYLWERREVGTDFAIGMASGPIAVSLDPGPPLRVRADVGVPHIADRYAAGATIDVDGVPWRYARLAVPNAHVVAFVDDVDAVDLVRVGASNAPDARFAGGTNVHVAQVIDRNTIRARHYERGVGLTQACGTGAVAVAVAAIDDGRAQSPVTIIVPGGSLRVWWAHGEHATLEGPAEIDYERTIAV